MVTNNKLRLANESLRDRLNQLESKIENFKDDIVKNS